MLSVPSAAAEYRRRLQATAVGGTRYKSSCIHVLLYKGCTLADSASLVYNDTCRYMSVLMLLLCTKKEATGDLQHENSLSLFSFTIFHHAHPS